MLNYTGFVWKWSWYWKKELLSFSGSIPSKIFGIQVLATKRIEFVRVVKCHIPNFEICPKHVWLQYNIKSPRLFDLICAQNSISSLVLYNELNFTKSPQLFCFIWVKIYSHIHLCPLPNYLLQTLQIYSDFMWSFLLSKSELLCGVLLMKHSLRDLF